MLGGAKHRVFRSALASPRLAAAELYALDSARAAKPVALFCFPDTPPPPPSQTRDISAGPSPAGPSGLGWQGRGWRGRKAGYDVFQRCRVQFEK